MKKMNSFAWLCVLSSCALVLLPRFAVESSKVSASRGFLIPSEDGHGTSRESAAMEANEGSDGRKLTASENISSTDKATAGGKGGKGSSGAANEVHQRPEKNTAAPLFHTPYLIALVFLGFSFSSLLAFP